jgi:hypothetical protein
MGDLFGGKSQARAARTQAEQLERDARAQAQVALANEAAARAAARHELRMRGIADTAKDALAPQGELVQIDLDGTTPENIRRRRAEWGIGWDT